MQALGKDKNDVLRCIANNMEKYITFSCGNLRFIDSIQFLNKSLSGLVDDLAVEGVDAFPHLQRFFPDREQQKKLLRKCPYPYDYIDSSARFAETELPPKEAFFNQLTNSHISDEDYEFAQEIWKDFHLSDLGEYHDLYVLTDVLLLACVFERHRAICREYYGLDAAHYVTTPSLTFDAMLKMTGVEIELLTDLDMYLMIESGVRGGVSTICNKYSKANNHLVENFDPSEDTSWIIYLDANNLYGTAMSMSLPVGNFRWMSELERETFDVNSIADDEQTGYILEVDLEYPKSLHDAHSDYPLAPESFCIDLDMLSPFTTALRERLNIKSKPTKKLTPNLRDKKHYVLHYRNLKFYLEQGLILKKIHRVISFDQKPFLKEYIDFNTRKRTQAENETQRNLLKLMNNSLFGKTMESVRNRKNVHLVNNEKKMKKMVSKPNFHAFKIFHQDLVAVHMKKVNVVLDRPSFIGFSVLDLSKLIMYKFHYEHMLKKYGSSRLKLLFTDTDSLMYEIKTDNLYNDMQTDLTLYDTSNYPKDHSLFSKERSKQLGCMKDESGGRIIGEFVGLRSKMYSYAYVSGEQQKRAKGIKANVIAQELKHDMYKECLQESASLRFNMTSIRSYQHEIYTIRQRKIGLSPYDDKRYVLENGCDTIAFGHYKCTRKKKEKEGHK